MDLFPLPRLLSDFTPLPGAIKTDYEDFFVEEAPLYSFSGQGTHTFFLLEKRGLSTQHAVNDLAHALGISRRAIGYAGLKDARSVSRQWMSIEHLDPQKLTDLSLPRMRVVETTRHGNKLRLGHLKGNRFVIRVRDTDVTRIRDAEEALHRLARIGAPNYFGPQRFGERGDTWQIGRALIRDDVDEAVDLILGRAGPRDYGHVREAREFYDKGRYEEAIRRWPWMYRDARRALKALVATGSRKRAFAAVDLSTRQFYVSAYQSYLFNQIVAQRIATGLDRLETGDLAWVHRSGAVFRVEDAQIEQPRADALEISATGPLYGRRMTEPEGAPGERESQLLTNEGFTSKALSAGRLRIPGGRRPLRFPPGDAAIELGADGRGPYLELRFFLPRGCYATCLLRELFSDEAGRSADFEGTETDLP